MFVVGDGNRERRRIDAPSPDPSFKAISVKEHAILLVFLFGFKARRRAHSELCNCRRNAEAEQKDKQDGMFFDRNRLRPGATAKSSLYFNEIKIL